MLFILWVALMLFLNHFHGFFLFPWAYLGHSNGRRGEEHSFILKPATSAWKRLKAQRESSQSSHLPVRNTASLMGKGGLPSKIVEGKRSTLTSDQYAVLVSCRCNYTGTYTCSSSVYYLKYLQEFVVYDCNIFILRFMY